MRLDLIHLLLYPGQLSQIHYAEILAMEMKIAGKYRGIKHSANARAQNDVIVIRIVGATFMDEGQRNLYGSTESQLCGIDQESHGYVVLGEL